MDDKPQEKRFLLRMDQRLYDELAQAAARERRSVNAYIISILQQPQRNTFEKRQIIGQVVSGATLNQTNGLVQVGGIYYRYLISDHQPIRDTAQYAIIEANGNILTLQQI